MALKILQRGANSSLAKKAVAVKGNKPVVRRVSDSGLVEDYASLVGEVKALKDELKEKESLLKPLQEKLFVLAEQCDNKEKLYVDSNYKSVLIGAKGTVNEVVLSPQEVYDLVGPEVFMAVVSLPIGALRDYCTKDQLEKILKAKSKGRRPLKVVAR